MCVIVFFSHFCFLGFSNTSVGFCVSFFFLLHWFLDLVLVMVFFYSVAQIVVD